MHIEKLKEGDFDSFEEQVCGDSFENGTMVVWDPKRVLVGAGARALFYPTLLYNVVRNKIQSEFRWWDRVDEFVLLGAVPFHTDVPHLKALGVGGVVTLNESYETLVSSSLYHDYAIQHLVIPTRDYLFAPSLGDISQAVQFIHVIIFLKFYIIILAIITVRFVVIAVNWSLVSLENALSGKTTYVHCKAGRGRSTTIVLCYLVKHKQMTPEVSYKHVRSIRPRVLLASSQWQAVQDYYHGLNKPEGGICVSSNSPDLSLVVPMKVEVHVEDFDDDNSLVLITELDLDGYKENRELDLASQSAFAISRLSCLWLRCHMGHKASTKKAQKAVITGQLKSAGVNISVY